MTEVAVCGNLDHAANILFLVFGRPSIGTVMAGACAQAEAGGNRDWAKESGSRSVSNSFSQAKMNTPAEGVAWYAVHTKLKYESVASMVLCQKGYEVLCPCYKTKRSWSDRYKMVELPLFPGYIFCKLSPLTRLPILCTIGVISIVGNSNGPLALDPDEVAAVQTIINSGVPAEPVSFDVVGQYVYIEKGPLAGLEGIVVNVKNSYRLVVTVGLLKRSIAAEVDRECVRLIPERTRIAV